MQDSMLPDCEFMFALVSILIGLFTGGGWGKLLSSFPPIGHGEFRRKDTSVIITNCT